MVDNEPSTVNEPDRNLRTITYLAAIIPSILLILTMCFCVILYAQNAQLRQSRDCVRRIDQFVLDRFYDVNLAGWDTLVARAEGSTNQDVRAIASDMRKNITTIKDTRQMRHDAISICDADPDFKPE